jgi:hypothetical protein
MILKRTARIVLSVLLVLALVAAFAVRTFLFDPFEGDYAADVATLVPRDVDFFTAKAELARDFADFPRLAIADRIEDTKAWRSFERSEYPALDEQFQISAALEQLRGLRAQLRGIDPLSIFGGRDVVLAGYFRGPDLALADWAAYGRVSWIGKLAVAMLRFPGLIGLERQGLSAAIEDDHVALSGANLPRELFVARVRDVVVVGSSLELVRKALELDAREGVDSFGQSAKYGDFIENADRGPRRDEIELYFDWRAWSENRQIGGRWPDPDSQDYVPRLLARLFQVGSLRNVSGVVGFDGGIGLDLHGELSSELMTTVQKQIYRQRGVERGWFMENVARMVRADAALVLYLQIDIGDLLRELLAAAEPTLRSLLEDQIRATGAYNGSEPLIAELGELFKDRAALIVRENTYVTPATGASDERLESIGDAPHNEEPVPAIALMLWTDGSREALARIETLHQLINRNQGRIGLRGPDGASGVYNNQISTGHDVWEFWSEFIDGTGHIATAADYDLYLITNHYRMIEDLMRVFEQGGSRYPRLSERPEFRASMEESLDQSNAILWLDPRSLARIRAPFHAQVAEFQVLGSIDWEVEAANEEARVVREQFPGQARGDLDPATQAKVNAIVKPILEEKKQRLRDEQLPVVLAELQRQDVYLSALSGVLVTLGLDQGFFDLKAQALLPLDESVD